MLFQAIGYCKCKDFSESAQCLENVSFDLRCNEFEKWLFKRNYNPIVVRKPILKARDFSRDSLLDKVKEVKNYDRFITYAYLPSFC